MSIIGALLALASFVAGQKVSSEPCNKIRQAIINGNELPASVRSIKIKKHDVLLWETD